MTSTVLHGWLYKSGGSDAAAPPRFTRSKRTTAGEIHQRTQGAESSTAKHTNTSTTACTQRLLGTWQLCPHPTRHDNNTSRRLTPLQALGVSAKETAPGSATTNKSSTARCSAATRTAATPHATPPCAHNTPSTPGCPTEELGRTQEHVWSGHDCVRTRYRQQLHTKQLDSGTTRGKHSATRGNTQASPTNRPTAWVGPGLMLPRPGPPARAITQGGDRRLQQCRQSHKHRADVGAPCGQQGQESMSSARQDAASMSVIQQPKLGADRTRATQHSRGDGAAPTDTSPWTRIRGGMDKFLGLGQGLCTPKKTTSKQQHPDGAAYPHQHRTYTHTNNEQPAPMSLAHMLARARTHAPVGSYLPHV